MTEVVDPPQRELGGVFGPAVEHVAREVELRRRRPLETGTLGGVIGHVHGHITALRKRL